MNATRHEFPFISFRSDRSLSCVEQRPTGSIDDYVRQQCSGVSETHRLNHGSFSPFR